MSQKKETINKSKNWKNVCLSLIISVSQFGFFYDIFVRIVLLYLCTQADCLKKCNIQEISQLYFSKKGDVIKNILF